MKLKYILFGIMLLSSVHVCGAGNGTLDSGDIMGDTLAAFQTVKEPTNWVTGHAAMIFVVISVISIIGGGIAAQGGSLLKIAAIRQHGMSTILGTIGITVLVIVSLLAFWAFITEFRL